MARLIHFKEAEETGMIRKGNYVSCPFWVDSILKKVVIETKETGLEKPQEVQVNLNADFVYQGLNRKSKTITLISANPVMRVAISGFSAYEDKVQDAGRYFSNYARKLDNLIHLLYSLQSLGIKAWCPQKHDIENISYGTRVALEGIWLANPYVQLESIYGMYFLNSGAARTEPLYNTRTEKWMEAIHGVAVGISLPDDLYIVTENFNRGYTSDRPIMWVNLDADNPLADYDLEIKKQLKKVKGSEQFTADLQKERSFMQHILSKSGKRGLLEGNWIC